MVRGILWPSRQIARGSNKTQSFHLCTSCPAEASAGTEEPTKASGSQNLLLPPRDLPAVRGQAGHGG